MTVRSRGVMEKCTYCVQRINHARIAAKIDGGRPVGGDEVVTACQAACPTRAIVFGNMTDPQSSVMQLKDSPAQLRAPDRAEHAAADHVPGPAAQPQPRDRSGPSGSVGTESWQLCNLRHPGTEDRVPTLAPGHTYGSVTEKISALVLVRPYNWRWLLGMGVGFVLTMMLLVAITYLFMKGVGIWGIDVPVMWGFAIVNFVWWIGIGHAGTLISAILLLLKQDWRTSINRFAEAMTLFAVACAGLFPLLHLGRPWVFYWLLPYPNTMDLWPQWRSPLVWDVFAVSTYATVSLLFWYVGLIPDLATLRDRAKNRFARIFYGILAMGWRGSARHWHRYRTAYLLLAGLATPLVVSVHSVVSLDFAVGIVPGWHSTIFPPYFVAGCDLLRLRDGPDPVHPPAGRLRPPGFHHRPPPRQHGQGHAGHRHDRGLRLPDGKLHGLVQPEPVRGVRDAPESAVRQLMRIRTG